MSRNALCARPRARGLRVLIHGRSYRGGQTEIPMDHCNVSENGHPPGHFHPDRARRKWSGVVVPKSAILWIIPGADFGTTNHTGKQCFASVLIDSEVRKAADPGMAKFRIATLEDLQARRDRHFSGTSNSTDGCDRNRTDRLGLFTNMS